MRIYTKKGDQGNTRLLGGDKVAKSHVRVEAYGTVDELNATIAHLHDLLKAENFDENQIVFLQQLIQELFNLGSLLATGENYKGKSVKWDDDAVERIENHIDEMNEALPPLRNFILPGGHPFISYCHICRTVCRRAERRLVALDLAENVDPRHLKYLNRLSDYFFTLARLISSHLGIEEEKWEL